MLSLYVSPLPPTPESEIPAASYNFSISDLCVSSFSEDNLAWLVKILIIPHQQDTEDASSFLELFLFMMLQFKLWLLDFPDGFLQQHMFNQNYNVWYIEKLRDWSSHSVNW